MLRKAKIFNFVSAKNFLKDTYLLNKEAFKPFSYDLMSEKLGFGKNPFYYQICHNIRPITEKTTEKLVKGLKLSKQEADYFHLLVDWEYGSSDSQKLDLIEEMVSTLQKHAPKSEEKYILYASNWQYVFIRELIEIVPANQMMEFAKSNGIFEISDQEIKKAFDFLQKNDLIRYDLEKNTWVQTEMQIDLFSSKITFLISSYYHKKILELAQLAVFQIPEEKRHFETLSLSVSQSQFDAIKAKIEHFLDDICEEYESNKSSKDQVAQLSIQLFPLLKTDEDE